MKKSTLIVLASVTAFAAQAAIISNEGATAPSTGIIAQNLATTAVGNREISWRSATIHSQIGQSFVATSDGTAMGISLFQTSPEDYATLYASPVTFKLKVFSGATAGTAAELGSYSYDASGLGDAVDDSWIRFALGSGVAMTSGNAYSFILSFDSLDADHRVNFQRSKNADYYASGDELRPATSANDYDATNFDTDPWDASVPQGAGGVLTAVSNSDMRFTVDTIPEPATLGLVAVFGVSVVFIRRRLCM